MVETCLNVDQAEQKYSNSKYKQVLIGSKCSRPGSRCSLCVFTFKNKHSHLDDPKQICCDIARPKKKGMLRPLHCNRKCVCCILERPKQFARLFASQNRYVATLCDPERYVATNAIKMSMLRLCATEMFERLYPVQKKDYVSTIATQNEYVATIVIQNGKKQPLR